MNKYRITAALPCYERPARTRRIINNLLAQTIDNWEAFIIGDGCPHFDEMVTSGEIEYFKQIAEEKGNKIHCFNLDENYGGCGYHVLNYVKENAQGKYYIILNNDDIIKPNHFEHYLSEIENTDLDLVYYKTSLDYIHPGCLRDPFLEIGKIGHSEIIVKTETAKQHPHNSEYGHDWFFIEEMIKNGAKHKKALSSEYTYQVMGTQGTAYELID